MRNLQLKGLLVAGLFIFHGCIDEGELRLTNRIEAITFTLQTPEGWVLEEVPAFDTYSGYIKGSHNTIGFDFGYLGYGGSGSVSPGEGTIYFKHLMINGDSAILHKRKIMGEEGRQIELAVYIENDEKTKFNRLHSISPSGIYSENAIIEIFRTHEFK